MPRVSHRALVVGCRELRDGLTVSEAADVALAGLRGTILITTDARLADASGLSCEREVVTSTFSEVVP
jgi:predicted nucleic acid-binding protein